MEELKAKLAEFGITDEEIIKAITGLGVASIDDLAELTADDLKGCGVQLVTARKLIKSLGGNKEPDRPAAPTMVSFDSILPAVPTDEAWLTALKVGGVIKVEESTYISAIRAALASKIGIYAIPGKLAEELEKFAEENDEPVSTDFYALSKQLTRRSYADIFAAIDGLDGTFVTEKRRKSVVQKIDQYVWPALANSYHQLVVWRDAWTRGLDPSVMLYAMAGQPLPPGIGAMPDTGALRDAGDDIRNAINKALSGVGSTVVAAMAYDYLQIKKVLEDPSLPARIGAANREQMFKKIGLTVESSVIRNEANLVRYAMSFVRADESLSADKESAYFSSLFMLGSQIGWNQLGVNVENDASGLTSLSGKRY